MSIANKASRALFLAISMIFIANTASAVTVEEIMIEKENYMYFAEQGDSTKLDKLNSWIEFARSGGAKSDFAEVYITGSKSVEELIRNDPETVYAAEVARVEGLRIAEEARLAAEAKAKLDEEQRMIAEKQEKIDAAQLLATYDLMADVLAFIILVVLMLVFYKVSFKPYGFVNRKIGSIYNFGVTYDKATMSRQQKFKKTQLDMTLSNIGMGISFISLAYIVVSLPYVGIFFLIKEYITLPLMLM